MYLINQSQIRTWAVKLESECLSGLYPASYISTDFIFDVIVGLPASELAKWADGVKPSSTLVYLKWKFVSWGAAFAQLNAVSILLFILLVRVFLSRSHFLAVNSLFNFFIHRSPKRPQIKSLIFPFFIHMSECQIRDIPPYCFRQHTRTHATTPCGGRASIQHYPLMWH